MPCERKTGSRLSRDQCLRLTLLKITQQFVGNPITPLRGIKGGAVRLPNAMVYALFSWVGRSVLAAVAPLKIAREFVGNPTTPRRDIKRAVFSRLM
jgi:hypothetical protein